MEIDLKTKKVANKIKQNAKKSLKDYRIFGKSSNVTHQTFQLKDLLVLGNVVLVEHCAWLNRGVGRALFK